MSRTTERSMVPRPGMAALATTCAVTVLFAGCGSGSEERRDKTHDTLVDSLVAEARGLVAQAEATVEPATRLALLDSARTRLYRAMSFSETSRVASQLADGAGLLSVPEIDRALRHARMDICRAAPDYECLIDNAMEAARATVPEGRDLAFRSIALAQARLEDLDGALETARYIPGFDPTARSDDSHDSYTYYPLFDDPRVVIVAMTARTGDPDAALEWAERLDVVTRVWREIAAAFARRGDTLQAADVVARAERLADGITDDEERTRVLVQAGLAWDGFGRSDRAAESLTRALVEADSLEPVPSRISLLVSVKLGGGATPDFGTS